jgi:hypothetical protein
VLAIAAVFSLLSTIAAVGTGRSRRADPAPSDAPESAEVSGTPSASVVSD